MSLGNNKVLKMNNLQYNKMESYTSVPAQKL